MLKRFELQYDGEEGRRCEYGNAYDQNSSVYPAVKLRDAMNADVFRGLEATGEQQVISPHCYIAYRCASGSWHMP
jgi:hypothetical protein